MDSDRDESDTSELILLCERQGLNYGTIAKFVYRFNNPDNADGPLLAIDFDTADKLLCGANMLDRWRGELSEYYYGVDLNWRTCACDGCSNYFYADPKAHGKKPIYCSKACANAASLLNRGKTERRFKNYGTTGHPRRGKKCRNGHPRTPENQFLLGNGKVRCRQCNREASARAYAKRVERQRGQVAQAA